MKFQTFFIFLFFFLFLLVHDIMHDWKLQNMENKIN